MSDEPLLPPRILFRFSAPCYYHEAPLWTAAGLKLEERYQLPAFAELDGRPQYAAVRAAWNEAGLGLSVRVEGKRQAPWCRDTHLDESDGLQVWIDTRDSHQVHRAGRFCHRFSFLPSGSGPRRESPSVGQLLINRAKEPARLADPSHLKVRSEKRIDGYLLETFIAAAALAGFDPRDNPRLGFHYAIHDRELGPQTFSVGGEFPHQEDPSLWGTLELVRD